MKTCPQCKEEKELIEFHDNIKWGDGKYPWCKPCRSFKSREYYLKHRDKNLERAKQYRSNNLDKVREYDRERVRTAKEEDADKVKNQKRGYQLKRNFGISLEQYNELLSRQNGGCAICGKTPEEEKRALAVEHDHKTKEIMGLCCWSCNYRLLGRIRNPDLYEKAAQYLRGGTGWFIPENRRSRRNRRGKTS